jgi:hypothetical protein
MDERTRELRMERQIERRGKKARRGLCFGCGTFRDELVPGRVGGYSVYCERCALVPRLNATLEGARS